MLPTWEHCAERQCYITLHELLFAYAPFVGMRIGDPRVSRETTWHREAGIFKSMWAAALRHAEGHRQEAAEFQPLLVSTLKPFGMPPLLGRPRRPHLLMGEKDIETLVANNALRILLGEKILNLPPAYYYCKVGKSFCECRRTNIAGNYCTYIISQTQIAQQNYYSC